MELDLGGPIDDFSAVECQQPSRLGEPPFEADQGADSPDGSIDDRVKGLEIVAYLFFPGIQNVIGGGGALGGKDSALSVLVNDLPVRVDNKGGVEEPVLDNVGFERFGLGHDVNAPFLGHLGQAVGFLTGNSDGNFLASLHVVHAAVLIIKSLQSSFGEDDQLGGIEHIPHVETTLNLGE